MEASCSWISSRVPRPQQFAGGGRVDRRREQVALGVIAPHVPQLAPLPLGLDALGHDAHPEVVAEIYDGSDDCRVAPARPHPADERAIDLEGVEGKLVKLAE
jgi:hypothetical protein